MKLLCFDRFEDLDVPKLMEIYRESNLENIPYFFPEETDEARGLERVEEGFRDYLKGDFFNEPGNRYYVLADGTRWASAIRLFPVPGRERSWYAEALETAPALRRRGCARKLLELLCRELAKGGAFELTDSVSRRNAASLAFHEAAGFRVWQDPARCLLNGEINENSLGLRYDFAGWEAQALDPAGLAASYAVRRLTEAELPELLALCEGNPLFYQHCPPAPSAESLLEDLAALPPRRTLNDKYFLGFFEREESGSAAEPGRLAAVLDLIPGFPKPEIAFWGFFMRRADLQGQGRGTALVSELCGALAAKGWRAVRLGWMRSNPQAAHFWRKNGFAETGISYPANGGTVVVAQREL